MTIQEFHDKAYEGGWRPHKPYSNSDMFLTPDAWQAVGKVEGWKGATHCGNCQKPYSDAYGRPNTGYAWFQKMQEMIHALAEGKTITQFLETL